MDGLSVLLVSASQETAEGMRRYLEGAGARVAVAAGLDAATRSEARALVLFADDFPADETAACLSELERCRGGQIVVLVSADPAIGAGPGADGVAIVRIPRPAWSWSVLDAIRTLLAEALERESR
jgi:CheY-like chemotaxis protein